MTKAVAKEPVPTEITEEKVARDLDNQIDASIKRCSEDLARSYVELAKLLNTMQGGGYTFLGFEKWGDYLNSKKEFGRTYLLYLYRLGQAGDLEKYLSEGMPGAKLIEYAKKVPPKKIPEVIEATWSEVKDKSVRETSKALNHYVAAHPDLQRKRRSSKKQKMTWKARFESAFKKVAESEREQYLKELQQFLKENKPAK